MKIILVIFNLLFCVLQLSSQDFNKYLRAYSYIDSTLKSDKTKSSNFNISPIIKFIDIRSFDTTLINNNEILKEINNYNRDNLFNQFFDSTIDCRINNKIRYDRYLLFSRPYKHLLLAELRNGNYSPEKLNDQFYFGEIIKYLFVFSDNGDIEKVFSDKIIVN